MTKIPDHPYRILIIEGSVSWKINSLFNLINHQPYIHKIYLYAKDLNQGKHQFLIKKREDIRAKHFDDSKTFTEYSNDTDNIYQKTEECNPNKKRKKLIVLMIWLVICSIIRKLVQ